MMYHEFMKEKKYIIEFDELMKEWHWEKNNELSLKPNTLTYGSTIPVWWKCKKCSHNWITTPNNRTNGKTGCPVCANREVVQGINDLATTHPEIAKRWHPTLNELKPTEVVAGCNSKAYFTCNKDSRHYFYTRIDHMILDDIQCPVCANQTIIVGVNDLATTHPELIKEWDYEKNTNIRPTEVTYGNTKKVWWKCKNNHSWKASIGSRAGNQKTGCPICKKELFISFPEKVISYYLDKVCKVEENKKFSWLGNSEVDIFLPDFNLAIEYDGQAWHKDYLRDLKKDRLCKDNNIQIIRIRENNCPKYESESIKLVCKKQNFDMLKECIIEIINYINNKFNQNIKINIDIKKDYNKITKKMDLMVKQNSIANSLLIKEWNWSKNEGLNPETIPLGSHMPVWWICVFGHEWESVVYSRTGKEKCGCPVCAGQKVLSGYNDLETLYPEIAREWDYKKNITTPNKIRPNDNKPYWWICKDCSNGWKIDPGHRVSGRGCPKCARQKTIASHFKKVLCLETGVIYNSVKEASEKNNLTQSNISNCCRGVSKTAGGYHWKYLENKKD